MTDGLHADTGCVPVSEEDYRNYCSKSFRIKLWKSD